MLYVGEIATPPVETKAKPPEVILVRRTKSGLSCLAGFRKDKPVWAPKMALAQRFPDDESILISLCFCFEGSELKTKAGMESVEVWPAPAEVR